MVTCVALGELVAVGQGLPGLQPGREPDLRLVQAHGLAQVAPVVLGGEPVHDLQVRVLDRVLDQLGGKLLGDDHALAVLAVLGECVGERLGCLLLGLGVLGRPGALRPGQQPVRFLDQRDVHQFPRRPAHRLVMLGDGVEQQRHHQRLLIT